MTTPRYRFLVAAFLLSLVVIDRGWHNSLFSMVPLFLIMPALLAWRSEHPLVWVVAWSGVALLLTTATPLVVGGVTFIPWFVRRLLPRIHVDLSFSFLFTLLLTAALQVGLVFATIQLPWAIVIPMCLLVASFAFAALLSAQQLVLDA